MCFSLCCINEIMHWQHIVRTQILDGGDSCVSRKKGPTETQEMGGSWDLLYPLGSCPGCCGRCPFSWLVNKVGFIHIYPWLLPHNRWPVNCGLCNCWLSGALEPSVVIKAIVYRKLRATGWVSTVCPNLLWAKMDSRDWLWVYFYYYYVLTCLVAVDQI